MIRFEIAEDRGPVVITVTVNPDLLPISLKTSKKLETVFNMIACEFAKGWHRRTLTWAIHEKDIVDVRDSE